MRIIAGEHRGRTILGPKDAETTRPITDRVKTALFDRLCNSLHVLGPDEGGLVLDIFSGTGSMGIESLSRGADYCVFVEQDRDAISRLEKNLDKLGLRPKAEILRVNALRPGWVEHLPKRGDGIRVSFVDPPFPMIREKDGWAQFQPLLESLGQATEPGGVLVTRTPKRVDPPAIASLDEPASYSYGSMTLHFYINQAQA